MYKANKVGWVSIGGCQCQGIKGVGRFGRGPLNGALPFLMTLGARYNALMPKVLCPLTIDMWLLDGCPICLGVRALGRADGLDTPPGRLTCVIQGCGGSTP